MSRLLLIFAIILSGTSSAQSVVSLKTWKTYPVPTDRDTLFKYNNDVTHEWSVFLDKDKVFVRDNSDEESGDKLPFKTISVQKTMFPPGVGSRCAIRVDDGYLVGFFRGEWGGNLYWFSVDGKSNYKISDHEIVQFIKRDDKIYAIEGVAHLSMSEGSIIEIRKTDGKWHAEKYLKLLAAPYAVDLDQDNNFVICTSQNLLTIGKSANIKVLTEQDLLFGLLYPTSLLVSNNVVYIGMRKGIFIYDLNSQKQSWMMPD